MGLEVCAWLCVYRTRNRGGKPTVFRRLGVRVGLTGRGAGRTELREKTRAGQEKARGVDGRSNSSILLQSTIPTVWSLHALSPYPSSRRWQQSGGTRLAPRFVSFRSPAALNSTSYCHHPDSPTPEGERHGIITSFRCNLYSPLHRQSSSPGGEA